MSRSTTREAQLITWSERTVVTPLGRALGLHTENQQFRLYRATLQAIVDGMVLGRGRHGVVMALSNDPSDPRFRLAVKIVHKYFTPSKGKEPSFHRAVAHTLHLQNEVAAMAKLSADNTFLLPLYCAFQDDLYVYLVCERGCCTLKQLIQHSHEDELQQLLAFQQAQPLKFLSFCMLMSLSMLHACWALQRARLIHHDIHPAQILVTADGRPRLSDLGQCSVIAVDQRKQLLPPLGRRDFCRPAKLGPLQGPEVDGYGCGATLWVTWKGSYDQIKKVEREWNKHEDRELLQEKIEQLANKAVQAPPPRWQFAALVQKHIARCTPKVFAESVRDTIEGLVTAFKEESPNTALSTFTVDESFSRLLPFLHLCPELASDDEVRLDPANFALPEVKPEEPWPPATSHPVYPVYVHAARVLRQREIETNGRSRSRVALPMLPEMPISLTTQPCQSMLLHPGRLRTAEDEPLVRVSIVSMLVVAQLPVEITVTAHTTQHPSLAGEEAAPPITLSFRREDFTQQGPSGPIESKKTFSLRLPQLQALVVRFELPEDVTAQLDFCDTAPLLIEKAPPEPAPPPNGTSS